ncbi:MAG: PASTA domain-containing protein [Atopobiaceae bacterium]|nr:PASTA domain-containing protein [Atopobiaceae bacterium]
MLCPQCHAEIPSSSRICPQCGAPQKRDSDAATLHDTELMGMAALSSEAELLASSGETVLLDSAETELLADVAETELLSDGVQADQLFDASTEQTSPTDTLPHVSGWQTPEHDPLDDTAPRDPVVMPLSGLAAADTTTQAEPKKKHRGLIAVAVLLVLAGIAAGIFFAVKPMLEAAIVPELAGQGRSEAIRLIEEAGLVAEVSELPADDNFDTVVNSSPVSGTTVDRGSTVTIIIAVPRIMPKLHGLTLEEANKILTDVGATNITTTYRHSSEAEGTVISATPAEGAQFRSTDEVLLVISKPYTVPEVVGIDRDEAIRLIQEAELGYKVEQIESEDRAGMVLSTDPVAGTRMSRGQTVILTVAAAGPRSETFLPDYIRENPSDVNDYLTWKGWSYGGSGFGSLSSANERWTKDGVGSLLFTPTPENGDYVGIGLSGSTSLGSEVEGVRFEPVLSGSFESAALTQEYLQQCAYRCGLGELTEFVTNESIVRPRQNSGFSFDFGSGSSLWNFGRTESDSSRSDSDDEGAAQGEETQSWDSRENEQGGGSQGSSSQSGSSYNSGSQNGSSSPAFLAGIAQGESLYWYLSVNADSSGNPASLTVAVGKRSNLEGKSLESYGDSLASYLAAVDHYGDK